MCSTMFIAGLFVKSQIIENSPDVPQQKNGYRAISQKEIEEVIKNHPTKEKKAPGQIDLVHNSARPSRKT